MPKGNVLEWDTHGFGCTICVDVAREVDAALLVGRRRRLDPRRDRTAMGAGQRRRPHADASTTREEVIDVWTSAPSRSLVCSNPCARVSTWAPSARTAPSTLAANPHLKEIFGYPPDAAENLVQPFDAARFVDPQARQTFIELLDRDGGVTDHLIRVRRVDGTPIWIEVSATASHRPLHPNQTQLAMLHVEALVRDVSERKKRDDQIRDGRYQMLQAEKMAALGQTISGVAHELNNPLATILSWAERLSERNVDDKTKQGLEVILGESERAARIVRNLLTFARKRQTTRAMVDLNQVVRETLALRAYEQKSLEHRASSKRSPPACPMCSPTAIRSSRSCSIC